MTKELMIQCINSDIDTLKGLLNRGLPTEDKINTEIEIKTAIIETLKAEPCEDCVSRDAVMKLQQAYRDEDGYIVDNVVSVNLVRNLPPVTPKQGLCKDCKWWKDGDGVYRRGIEAETPCPINRKAVFEGNGYCYLFEKMEGEDN